MTSFDGVCVTYVTRMCRHCSVMRVGTYVSSVVMEQVMHLLESGIMELLDEGFCEESHPDLIFLTFIHCQTLNTLYYT